MCYSVVLLLLVRLLLQCIAGPAVIVLVGLSQCSTSCKDSATSNVTVQQDLQIALVV